MTTYYSLTNGVITVIMIRQQWATLLLLLLHLPTTVHLGRIVFMWRPQLPSKLIEYSIWAGRQSCPIPTGVSLYLCIANANKSSPDEIKANTTVFRCLQRCQLIAAMVEGETTTTTTTTKWVNTLWPLRPAMILWTNSKTAVGKTFTSPRGSPTSSTKQNKVLLPLRTRRSWPAKCYKEDNNKYTKVELYRLTISHGKAAVINAIHASKHWPKQSTLYEWTSNPPSRDTLLELIDQHEVGTIEWHMRVKVIAALFGLNVQEIKDTMLPTRMITKLLQSTSIYHRPHLQSFLLHHHWVHLHHLHHYLHEQLPVIQEQEEKGEEDEIVGV